MDISALSKSVTEDTVSVLVLDDEQEIVDTIIDILDGVDLYRVEGSNRPEKVLKRIEQGEFDIILTDLVMPEFTGIDVANFVKEKNLDVLVIVITGYATIESAIQAVQLGVYDYIKKPFDQNDIHLVLKRAVQRLQLERKNKILNDKNQRMIGDISLMCEISSILYQVHDVSAASQMILDTVDEYFKLPRAAVALKDESTERFRILNARNLKQTFADELTFTLNNQINDVNVSDREITIVDLSGSEIKTEGRKIHAPDFSQLVMIPVLFHNSVDGFVLLFLSAEDVPISDDILKLLKIMSIQVAPVIHAFQCKSEHTYSPVQQLEHLIKDALLESQSMLRPVSFALFRIDFQHTIENPAQLAESGDAVRRTFNSIFPGETQFYWLGSDTVLTILPENDYFETESFCTKAKEKLESASRKEDQAYTVHYSCLGFPQSGENITDINGELWCRLLYEHKNASELHKTG